MQDVTDPTKLELQQPYAKIELEDKSTVAVNAKVGFYDTQTQLLRLDEDIFVQTSSGYEGRLKEAIVDMGKGTLRSDKPVAIKMPTGTLDAQRMTVSENGAIIKFENGIMTFEPRQIADERPAQEQRKMNTFNLRTTIPFVVAAITAIATVGASAQNSVQGVPNAMQGFTQNRNQPMQMNSGSLEIRDKDKAAVFSGKVRVRQYDHDSKHADRLL